MIKTCCARASAILIICIAAFAGRCDAKTFLEPGRLELGANYWSSFNATKMWREWRPDEIEKDFIVLKELGMTMLRVFPTWSDFQPIVEVHANCSRWDKSKDTRMTLDEIVQPRTEAENFCFVHPRHELVRTVKRFDVWLSVMRSSFHAAYYTKKPITMATHPIPTAFQRTEHGLNWETENLSTALSIQSGRR